MKRILGNPAKWFSSFFALLLLMVLAKGSFAVHQDTDADGIANCDIGQVNGNCTINSVHAIGSNVTIEGDLIITSTGHIKFTGTVQRTLYVKGSLVIETNGTDKGKISYEGTGTATPAEIGGNLTIIVDGNVTVAGEVSVKGGNGNNVFGGAGVIGGNGGSLTFNVCGDFTSTGDITARGGNGGNSTGRNATSGGNGGSGGAITINVNGNVAITAGTVHAQGGIGGNPQGTGQNGGDGTITINTQQTAVNTAGANFNPNPTVNLSQVDPAQCRQPVPQGCSLGFWKNHTGAWQGYLPNQTVDSVFANAPPSLAGATLLEALSFPGDNTLDGAKQILLRQAVAALLNAAHPDVFYPRTVQSVIDDVSAQLASSTRSAILALAKELDADNNLGCPLN